MSNGSTMDKFDTIWNNIQTTLKPGTEIKNWNTYHGYLGDSLTIKEVDPNYISLDPPRVWDTQVLPKEGFKKIWHVWADYRALRLKRGEIGELTDSSKYIISILRWYETEVISNKSQVNE